MHLWHVTALFFSGLGFALGYFIGRWRTIRRRTLRNVTLDRVAENYNVRRKVGESDSALRARIRAVMTGGFLLLTLAGCANWRVQPVQQHAAAQSADGKIAWFIMRTPNGDDEIWACNLDGAKMCRRYGR